MNHALINIKFILPAVIHKNYFKLMIDLVSLHNRGENEIYKFISKILEEFINEHKIYT